MGTMELVSPNNENLLEQLTPNEKAHYGNYRAAAERVSRDRPDLKTDVFTRFLKDYLDAATAHRQEIAGMEQRAANANVPLSTQAVRQRSVQMKYGFMNEFVKETLPQYGADGKEAFDIMANKLRRPGIMESLMKNIYDSDMGGWQVGGIIGAVVGFIAGKKLTGGATTIRDRILTVITTIAGAWMFKKAAHAIGPSTPELDTPPFPSTGTPASAPAPAAPVKPALRATPKTFPDPLHKLNAPTGFADTSQPSISVVHVDPENSGTLKTPVLPSQANPLPKGLMAQNSGSTER